MRTARILDADKNAYLSPIALVQLAKDGSKTLHVKWSNDFMENWTVIGDNIVQYHNDVYEFMYSPLSEVSIYDKSLIGVIDRFGDVCNHKGTVWYVCGQDSFVRDLKTLPENAVESCSIVGKHGGSLIFEGSGIHFSLSIAFVEKIMSFVKAQDFV